MERKEDSRCSVPTPSAGLGAMFKGRAQGSLKRTLKCCHCCHQGFYKNPGSTVILNVQSGQTVLVKNQKPVGRANTNQGTYPPWVGRGGEGWWEMVQTRVVYTANGLYYNDWQFRVSSQFHCCSSPKRANQRKREKSDPDGACRVGSSRLGVLK